MFCAYWHQATPPAHPCSLSYLEPADIDACLLYASPCALRTKNWPRLRLKILVDMNLSPGGCRFLELAGWQAGHWRDIGSPTAEDANLLAWARRQGFVLLSQDLRFRGTLFSDPRRALPSVVLLRLRNELDPSQQLRICTLLKGATPRFGVGRAPGD